VPTDAIARTARWSSPTSIDPRACALHDIIIRLGGEGFLCAMTDTTLSDMRERFDVIASDLMLRCLERHMPR